MVEEGKSGEVISPLPSCATCIKVKVCKAYESMTGIQSEFNARFSDIVKFPFDSKILGSTCSEYLSPMVDIRELRTVEEIDTRLSQCSMIDNASIAYKQALEWVRKKRN